MGKALEGWSWDKENLCVSYDPKLLRSFIEILGAKNEEEMIYKLFKNRKEAKWFVLSNIYWAWRRKRFGYRSRYQREVENYFLMLGMDQDQPVI